MPDRLVVFESSKRKLVHLLAESGRTACDLKVAWEDKPRRGSASAVTCPACRRQTGMPSYVPPKSKAEKGRAKTSVKPKIRRRPAYSGPAEPKLEQPNIQALVSRIRWENPELYVWCCYVERWMYVCYAA